MNRAVSRIAWAIATWFGCGRMPKAPGTAGSVGAIPLYLVAMQGGQAGVAATALGITAVGIWASSVVARELGTKDPQVVVVDEVAGLLITMLPVAHVSWQAVLVGFVLFRLFDSTKPWPIRWFETLPGGWGIVLDDVSAGAFGACVMAVLQARGVLR
jgi:phosphatidylglycerophosphatase A